MKHLLNKNLLQGGGKSKPKPLPAILRPPEIGNFEILNSYSVAEIVDLISDGPIYGFVNQNGQLLGNDKSIMQGIYLDNTPIETSSANSTELVNTNLMYDLTGLNKQINKLGDIFYDYSKSQYKTYHHKPIYSIGKLFTQLDESALFMSRVREGDTLKSLYSPINNGTVGESGNGWMWNGNKADDSLIRYFSYSGTGSDLGRDMEVHYMKNSLFASGTILNTLQKEINFEINNTVNNSALRIAVAKKAKNIIDDFADNNKNDDKKFDWSDPNEIYIIAKIGSNKNEGNLLLQMNTDDATLINAFDANLPDTLAPVFFNFGEFQESFSSNDIIEILIPQINYDDNRYNGKIFGCVIFKMTTSSKITRDYSTVSNSQPSKIGKYDRIFFNNILPFAFKNDKLKLNFYKGIEPADRSKANKYNFLNVSCELKNGNEYQEPLKYFSNIYNDFDYNSELVGPFRKGKGIQNITGKLNSNNASNPSLSIPIKDAIEYNLEGSDDIRKVYAGSTSNEDYSNWNQQNSLDEDATSITHTIENPNVTSVYFTLGISALSDTIETDKSKGTFLTDKTIKAGSKIPSIVNIKVEWGKTTNGVNKVTTDPHERYFSILALIEGQMLIDFGSPDLKDLPDNVKKSIKEYNSNENKLQDISNISFNLPPLVGDENSTSTKRFIKITKISAETNSVLINKNIFLSKVTEIIENKLSYPFSAIVGMKLDARSFSSIPERSYDCRLKKVQIPSNYKILNADGSDKRYVAKASSYTSPKQIYIGDWNGEFTTDWTDNPAWIIYDLLTSKRYGLGSYIDESQINKWELYKIARFCDAVDDNGFFLGVSDGVGGLEPRYSCNIVFKEQTKIFDAINIVANLFRGVVFFSNSEIHFLDDRPRTPISIFTNSNVKDGIFNYGNNRRDQQFNTVEVAYLDRLDNYQSKIEYVQDESDIRKRGIFKTTINTMGVTSRAMARRIGQHLIYQTIKENQTVEFIAGLESLLCRPGDLVIIEDELKTRSSNYGRVLSINKTEKSLIIDNEFLSGDFDNKITVYTPTGYSNNNELTALSQLKRSRVDYFNVFSGMLSSADNILTGTYYFSGYISNSASGIAAGYSEQYPIYTGKASGGHDIYCYYNTGYTGFVFSTGKAFQDNVIYDKVITNTGVNNIFDIKSNSDDNILQNNFVGFRYTGVGNRRTSPSGEISGKLLFDQIDAYKGILNTEIEQANHTQITKFNLTGYNNLDYGSKVYIDQNDINVNLVSIIADGSPYRLERKNASDQIYKIISIREQNQNEYSVVASKYNTGKFVEIENFATEDFLPDTYFSGPMSINNVDVLELSPPQLTSFYATGKTSTSFSLTGSWSDTINSFITGFKAEIFNTISNDYFSINTLNSVVGLTGLSALGQWQLRVSSLGNGATAFNSMPSQTGAFVAYSTITQISQPAITNFTLL